MLEALSSLYQLARSEEWNTLSQTLAPEIHELVSQWDTLSSEKKGELAGYAFGKYGADIVIPGAVAKAVGIGLQGAQELSAIRRTLVLAEESLIAETTAGLGNGAKIAEIVQLETKISEWLGEGTQFIRNKAGDPIFISKDGMRKVRFDFNRPAPHENPHMHFEQLTNGEWKEINRVYPYDVPHK